MIMKKIIITAACLACAFLGKAQERGASYNLANTAMTFLSIPVDARSGGMGELGIATAPDNYSHQNNAAKYVFLDPEKKGGVNLFYAPWLRNLVKDMSIAGISGFYRIDNLQAVSASFRYFSMGELKYRDDEQQVTGEHTPYELAVDLAYSRKLSESFSMSLGFRYGLSNVAGNASAYYEYKMAHVVAFDLNAYYHKELDVFGMKSILGAGAGISNIGGKVKYGEERDFFLPAELKLGADLAMALDNEHGISLGAELGKYLVSSDEGDRRDNVFSNIASSFSDGAQMKELIWKVGAEYGYNDFLFARAGYSHESEEKGDRQYLTFGAGVVYKMLHLDGSYLVPTSGRMNPLQNTFRISMSVNF